MTLQDAIQTLQQFERLDDGQVSEIVGFMTGQAAEIETQGLVLAARDKIIDRQGRMIEKAAKYISQRDCVVDGPCPANYVDVGCEPCTRKWLEEAAGND